MIEVTLVTDGTTNRRCKVLDADGKVLTRVQKISLTFEVGKLYPSGKLMQVLEDGEGKTKWVDSPHGMIPETRVVYYDVIHIRHPESARMTREAR